MTASKPKSMFLKGAAEGLPFILVVVPFAALFGVVGSEAGLNLVEVMAFSVLVIAGAAQFTALQLMQADAPLLIILATSLAVNLRMAMYSASLTPHLGKARLWQRALAAYLLVDQSYAMSVMTYARNPDMTPGQKLGYFFGVVAPIVPTWYAGTLAGALAGSAIPPEFALDFAVPITFIAMVAPMVNSLAHLAAAAVSIALALALAGLPYGSGLLVAAVVAMVVGARVELMLERRHA